MDELDIYEELQKINSLHHSLDEKNVMTYCILRESNRARFSDAQIKWINDRIDSLHERQRQALENSLQNVDVELAKSPLSDKTESFGVLREYGETP
jgi:hypothetical protein